MFPQRCLASYLASDQTPWVAADCADAASLGALPEALLLFGAAATVEQFRQVGAVSRAKDGPETVSGVATLLDVLGTDAVPVLEQWEYGRYTRVTLEPIWIALAALPSDAAFAALFQRHSSRFAMAYVRRAMDRDPERAMRVLATTSGTSDLLREHVVTRTEVAERVLPGLADGAATRIRYHLDESEAEERVPAAELPALLHRPPWTDRKRVRPVTVPGLEAKVEATMAWLPGEREERSPARPDDSGGGPGTRSGWARSTTSRRPN